MSRLLVLCALLFGSSLVPMPAAAEKPIPLTGVLRNHVGQVLPGVTIRGFRRVAPGWQILTTTTTLDGTFALSVPNDRWIVMADADQLLARGYFCVPGWIGGGAQLCDLGEGIVLSPLICGQLGDPIIFEAVPTRPDLSVTKEPGSEPVLHLTYPWTTLPMITVRQYVIEKSLDMEHWATVATVALDGYGRVDLADAGSAKQPLWMYRAVETTPVTISF